MDSDLLQTTINPALIKYFREPEAAPLTKSQEYLRSKRSKEASTVTQSVIVKEPLRREQRRFVVPDPNEMYTQSLIME